MKATKPQRIRIPLESNEYRRLLKRGEESTSFHSGLVTLQPGESIGQNSTDNNEEIIFVLQGEGELVIDDNQILRMNMDFIMYCPPNTKHDVKNTGNIPLKYIFVSAKLI